MKTVSFMALLFFSLAALAQTVAPEVAAPLAAAPAADMPPADYLTMLFEAIKALGGLPWAGKVLVLVNLVVASMKVSVLRAWIWDRMGWMKFAVAPLLGLLGGLIGHFTSGVALTLPNAAAYLFAGAGAILLHEALDGFKKMPKLGAYYVKLIDLVQALLEKGKLAAPKKDA